MVTDDGVDHTLYGSHPILASLLPLSSTHLKLAHLFLNPKVYKRLSIPLYFPQTLSHGTPTHPASPLLTRYAYSAMAKTRKLEVQAEVAKLLQSSGSSGTKLDLEEIIRSGQEAIETLANKLEGDGSGWFFGTE